MFFAGETSSFIPDTRCTGFFRSMGCLVSFARHCKGFGPEEEAGGLESGRCGGDQGRGGREWAKMTQNENGTKERGKEERGRLRTAEDCSERALLFDEDEVVDMSASSPR